MLFSKTVSVEEFQRLRGKSAVCFFLRRLVVERFFCATWVVIEPTIVDFSNGRFDHFDES